MKLLATIALIFSCSLQVIGQDKSFVVVIPSYNNKDRFEENLDSVFFQTYQNFRVVYIDDASPDGTGGLVKEYIRKHHLEHKVTLIRNEKRVGALANVYKAVWRCFPREIVVDLDGDDRLAHENVLTELNEVYADEDVWLTYGDWLYYPSQVVGGAKEVPPDVIERNEFRSFHRGGSTPLRTFYAGLFHRIKREDFLYNGEFFKVASDLAFMFPMLEMAGKHIKFIPQIHYVYNNETPINDHQLKYQEQQAVDRFLRSKKKYLPLDHFCLSTRKTVYITPGQWGQLFYSSNHSYGDENVMHKLRRFASELGYDLVQATSLDGLKDFEYLIVFEVSPGQLPYLEQYPREKRILFLWEPPTIIPENYNLDYHRSFAKIFTYDDSIVDNKRYYKVHYPVFRPLISDVIGFESKKFSAMVNFGKESTYPLELLSERRRIVNYFEDLPLGEFDLYGSGWPSTLRNFRGPVEKKIDCIKSYKFVFCYENTRGIPGYVTEKIFDALHAGSIPIYMGAPNIADYVLKNCFIAREDFPDEKALYEFMQNMTKGEFNQYLENIERFLESEKAQLFSPQYFIETFMNLIMESP